MDQAGIQQIQDGGWLPSLKTEKTAISRQQFSDWHESCHGEKN